VEWQRILRNCAEVVRVEILYRDPNRIPAGRLFNFHGKLFQLQFTAEIPNAPRVQRDVVTGQDGSNVGGGPGSGTNGMDTDGRSEANMNNTNSQCSRGSNQQVEPGSGTHRRQVTANVGDTAVEEVIPGSEVYKLLLEKGAIGTDGQFVWEDHSVADEGVRSEVTSFWQEEWLTFVERMEEADEEQLHLPEDIMPTFDGLLRNREAQGAGKKQKVAWGPVQPVIQSERIDRSKNVMDKAMELKEKKKTLGGATKMTGIIKSNPFHVLQVDELSDLARKIGIHVDTTAIDDRMDSDSFGSVNI
jgi:hypothetical protein